jgi:hypothetical protein
VRALVLLLLAMFPGAAAAWPVDVQLDLEAGLEKFERPQAIDWVEVEDPKIATAEVMESGELLFTGVAPGRTVALLYAEGKLAAWRIRVWAKGARPRAESSNADLTTAARKACPKLELSPSEVKGLVFDERCRQALLALFKTEAYLARQVELTFELAALQGQLASIQAALPAGVTPAYFGAGLQLKGTAPTEVHRKALWEVFRRSAGRVALDDQISSPPAEDAGTTEKP